MKIQYVQNLHILTKTIKYIMQNIQDFRSMTAIDYFLWIHLKEDKLSYFIEKYKLKSMY